MRFIKILLGKERWPFFLACFFLIFSSVVYVVFSSQGKTEYLVHRFQQSFYEGEVKLDHFMLEVKSNLEVEGALGAFDEENYSFYKSGMEVLAYKNDTLVGWTDNKIPIPAYYKHSLYGKAFLHLENGFYYAKVLQFGSYKLVGFLRLKSDYPYKNKYLNIEFIDHFNLSPTTSFSSQKGAGAAMFNGENKYVFSVDFHLTSSIASTKANWISFIFIMGYIVLLYALAIILWPPKYAVSFGWVRLLLYLISVGLLRYSLFLFDLPFGRSYSPLFSPAYYAASKFLPSLGDLLLTVISFFFLCFFVFKLFSHRLIKPFKQAFFNYALVFLTAFILVFSQSWILSIFQGMIVNSKISMDLNSLNTLGFYSLIGFTVIGVLNLAYFLLATRLILLVRPLVKNQTTFFVLIFSALIFSIAIPFEMEVRLYSMGVGALLFAGFAFILNKRKSTIPFSFLLYFLLIFSGTDTLILQDTVNSKEKEQRKILATRLSLTANPIAEYRFSGLANQIKKDTTLINLLAKLDRMENDQDLVVDYLRRTYFNGFWDRFNLGFNVCPEEFNLEIQPGDYVVECQEYFDGLISTMGSKTSSPNLFALNEMGGKTNYISRFEFFDDRTDLPLYMLYIEMYAKFLPEEFGYPALLIDDDLYNFPEITDYSYARYHQGKLMYKYGNYSYKLELDQADSRIGNGMFLEDNLYSHYFDNEGPETVLVVSKKSKNILDLISPFPYLFLFYGLLSLLILGGNWLMQEDKEIILSFRTRFQIAILVIILFSFIIVGISTTVYISRLNNQKNMDILKEKTHSVQIELEHKIENLSSANQINTNDLQYLLKKFSKVFFSDINFYSLNGNLLATSLPEIFEKGLVSRQMNPKAYRHLDFEHDLLFIEKEAIGAHTYLSAYINFTNSRGEVIAYLNLPYFARQGEIEKEIGGFLITYINIYMLLTALAVIIAIFIARYITLPLQIIRDKLRAVSLGPNNDKIEWKKDDEIGGLVKEYNRMIDELSLSADKLARSERESAWREMAKQVAHEIKNPLTPMKLSVQYLQKAYDDEAPDWGQRLKRFSQTLIEQIDTLSSIATAFSDFAKMPVGKPEPMDLASAIRSTADLFVELETVQFEFSFEKQDSCLVFADSTQLIRVFNNLFKNAIQAIPRDRQGVIIIRLKIVGKHYLVEVKDNGKGIPQEQWDKIFVPNFTTKTSGMGLGLAMVRNIVKSAHGSIWFESTLGVGTRFFLEFPIHFEE